jgi:hypothetical protein
LISLCVGATAAGTKVLPNPRGWETQSSPPITRSSCPSPDTNYLLSSVSLISYVGQVAKIAAIKDFQSRSCRVNFRRLPTTHSALANENMHIFRDETASDPFITVARHVFLSAQDALDALKSHRLLMINMVRCWGLVLKRRLRVCLSSFEVFLNYAYVLSTLQCATKRFLLSFLVYCCSCLKVGLAHFISFIRWCCFD